MSVNFKPMGDRILVSCIAPANKTQGGIFLPESAKDKPQTAKVVAVGEGRSLENGAKSAMVVKVGDVVYFTQWSGAEVEISGEKYLVMKESDVLGIIQG